MSDLAKVLDILKSWIGYSEGNGKHKIIIDIYNKHKPLPRGYKVKYSDEWCDTTISAAFIKAGLYGLIGAECSCQKHIEIFKSKNIWIEDGSITPKIGDIILFNWDCKKQPNNGNADHIGFVEKVKDGYITTIEGNKNNSVSRRKIKVGEGVIRGYARPKYKNTPAKPEKPTKPTKKKSEVEIAIECLKGKHGNGEDRKKFISSIGYDYKKIQRIINELVEKDYFKVVEDVKIGKYGNGNVRKEKLEKKGYDYDIVQGLINR